MVGEIYRKSGHFTRKKDQYHIRYIFLQTYNYYYVEFDECTMKPTAHGLINELFPGIPTDVNGSFRYINGNLYFFRNQTYYEYNEFSNKLTKAGSFDLSLFGINCPNEGVFTQIKKLLSQLSYYDRII